MADKAATSSGKSDSSTLKTALNEALVLGLSGRDSANLSDLLNEYFVDSISSDDDDDVNDDLYSDSSEPEPMDIDDFPSSESEVEEEIDGAADGAVGLVPDLAQQIIDIEGTDDWTSPDNDEELAKINNFSKCTCPPNKDPCTNQFEPAYILQLRAQMSDAEMTKRERKMFIMGRISSTIKKNKKTLCSKRARQTDRTRSRVTYLVDGTHVCRKSFLFMHNIGNDQLSSIIRHYEQNGVVPIKTTAGGRRNNTRALTDKDVTRAITFIVNYAEREGMVIPGRIPGVKCSDPRVRLLPSRDNKSIIWRQYKSQLESTNEDRLVAGDPEYRVAGRSTFTKMWRRYTPFILTTKPMSDLCWQCQQNNNGVYRSANLPEDQKLQRLQCQEEHLRLVYMERELYRNMVEEAKRAVNEGEKLGRNDACSRPGQMHYAFDFAQQVHYPSDPLQPGPMYFLCPRKCGIFGVCCEAIPQQANYLIDEGVSVGKGSNAVISYLHDFFENFGLGEEQVHLHCDNCGGQNKNKYVMWYFAWRAMTRLHKSITVNFMIAGHTKFAPDWCFGLVKQRYRRTMVSCLADLEEVVRSSSVKGVNVPRVVGTEKGHGIVPTYNWQEFLSPYFRPMPKIKSCHHMRFSHDHPGKVFSKLHAESVEQEFQLLLDASNLPPRVLPEPLLIQGLSFARMEYLHKHIREFCSASTRDITCPRPHPKSPEPAKTDSEDSEDADSSGDSSSTVDSTDDDEPLIKLARCARLP